MPPATHTGHRTPHGVLPVFQTPFHDDESIDFDVLAREIDWLFECGADGLVMAMVSEVLRLSTNEREEMAEFVCQTAGGRGVVIVSVGSESSHTCRRLAEQAENAGADAVMAIPPVSVALDDGELRQYYERILASVSIPVVVQDASGYVGRPMSIEMQANLYQQYGERVLFKPEATPIGPRLTELHQATGCTAKVFEGSGGMALVDSYQRGVAGTMPGADLIKALVALWRSLEAGDEQRAQALSLPLVSLVALQNSLDAFLAVEKHLLVRQGIFKNTVVRGPVGYRIDEPTQREVDRLFGVLMGVVEA